MTGLIELTLEERETLGALVAAGEQGLRLGIAFKLSTAIRLEMAGFARIENGRHPWARATAAGATFHRRGAT
ncbi:MAG: hypothetical protein V4656_17150 [Pseudomonadota bacterium]